MSENTAPAAARTVVVLVGSLRAESVNRKLARLIAGVAPADVDVQIVDDLSTLPYYNQDLDSDGLHGDAVEDLRTQVGAADAVLLATPEYNGGLPAVLKNAIDWLSRPYGAGAFTGKPVGVIGAALSAHAAEWARRDARTAVGIAGGHVVEEIDFGVRSGEFDETSAELAEQAAAALNGVLEPVSAGA
ncbi:MAG: NAD(P)H-dependent oxidoreductase [Gordonia sp. (in: high G+C Gram-positive bacteria)]|uniref:NAD(P)H-dependent oxidoreductase n=1 Tax=Gordonia sp. (in: high G+C Gram-positive bacteria) TaxID=84139 RepID=UPI0039E2F503